MAETKDGDRRSSKRTELDAKIEFFVNADIINARSVDVSKTGLRFNTKEPMKIYLRMEIDGRLCDREAQFVWATRNPDGTMTYGLKYIHNQEEYIF